MHGGDRYRNQVKLDFSVNINPFGMPKKVIEALHSAVEECVFYPDEKAEQLKNAISKQYGIDEKYVLVGNGASEVFAAVFHALRPKRLLTQVPGFSGYRHVAEMVGCSMEEFLLEEKNEFLLTRTFLEHINESIDLIVLTNPNNPTGKLIERALMREILEKTLQLHIPVLLDVCFYELAGGNIKEIAQWTKRFPQLIVVGAFTKNYGMPGVRLGFGLFGKTEWKDEIQKQLPEWNVSYLAQAAGAAALAEKQYLQKTVAYLEGERPRFLERIRKVGIRVFETDANFVLIKTEKPLYDLLLKKQILIRSCRDYKGLSEQYYRFCIKTKEENEVLIRALEEIYGKD